ncbi:MAG: hypothetical protein ACKV2V_14815 [Blastocatellia bacterium]
MRALSDSPVVRPLILFLILSGLVCPAGRSVAAQQPGVALPVSAEAGGQKTGSVLLFGFFGSSATSPGANNTNIAISNMSSSGGVTLQLGFVNGASGENHSSFLCLTANQTVRFNASDYAPGTAGYLYVAAIDRATGCPVSFNHLAGEANVKMSATQQFGYKAMAVAALYNGLLPGWTAADGAAQLRFDGVAYNRLPRGLVADRLRGPGAGNSMTLILTGIGGNLTQNSAATLGAVNGALVDQTRATYSFSFTQNRPQMVSALSDTFPQISPPLSTLIPPGQGGWLQLQPDADRALIGFLVTANPGVASAATAYNGGHALHALSVASSVSLTIPVIQSPC